MRILVVDDHALFREGVASLLNAHPDLTVVGLAESVHEAIARSHVLEPDIVLMDFSLPDGNGLDATRSILAERPHTKIVFLTVHEEDENLFEAIRCGAKGYLLKNTPVNELLTYLRGVAQGEAALAPSSLNRILEEFAQTPPRIDPETDILSQLTERQLEVLRELRSGASNKEIAERLVISEQTVKNHVHHILDTLNLNSRYEAANLARHHNL
jgi:DNA-binding NarL/FixJ family response regulator